MINVALSLSKPGRDLFYGQVSYPLSLTILKFSIIFSSGNLKNWWEEETQNRFLEKANCIIWQYGNYTADSVDKNLNGINTQVNNLLGYYLLVR